MNQSVEMMSFEGDKTSGSANDFSKSGLLGVVLALVVFLATVFGPVLGSQEG